MISCDRTGLLMPIRFPYKFMAFFFSKQMTLVNNRRVLHMLREMLLLIRLWSRITPSVKPVYTKTLESYDVIERLFHLITKYKENQLDESIHEECILLPSHVIIPRIQTVWPARGMAPQIVGLTATNVSYEYGSEPDSEWALLRGVAQPGEVGR